MRKKNLGSRIVKKAITWAMVVMMSLSTAVSGLSTMTVYAQEAQEEQTADHTEVEVIVTEQTETKEETYSDGELVTDDTATEQDEVADAIEGEELDYTKVETTVKNVETHYVIADAEGEAVVGTDAEGNEVEQIEVDAENVEVKEVQVIEKETEVSTEEGIKAPVIEEVTTDIIYGSFNEDGAFVEGTAEDGTSKAYTLTDGTYKETTTVNVVTGIDGATGEEKEYFVTDEVVDVLNGETVEGYEKKTVYYVGEGEDKVAIAQEDLEERLHGTSYTVNEETGELTITVSVEETNKPNGGNGKKSGKDHGKNPNKGQKEKSYYIMIDGEKVSVDEGNVETKTTYQVVDESGNMLCEVDAAAKTNIEKRNYTKVSNMYVVKDENNEEVYFTADQWQVVTSKEVTYEEVTRYYYTSENKYEGKEFEITSSKDNLDYLLSVNFWDSEYVKLDPDKEITYAENENGDIVVTIPYLYAGDYEVTEDSTWTEGTYVKTIARSEFGLSRIAILNVKYAPTVTKSEKVTFEAEIVEEKTEGTQTPAVETTTVIVNNGNPINEKPSNNKIYNHVDVQADTAVEIEGEKIKASVSDVVVSVGGHGIPMSSYATQDPQRYYEYRSTSQKLNITSSSCVTITAKITYTYEGKEYNFNYTVNVYPTNDEYNTCKDKNSGGFDYLITDTALQAAIQEDIVKRSVVITENKETTESGELGDAAEAVEKIEIPAKVFVRLDNDKQKEDGTTHYDSKYYTTDLAKKYGKEVYLGYSKEGFAVHDNNLNGSTATDKIYTKLAAETYEENLKLLADLYIQNERQQQVKDYTETEAFQADIEKQIESAKENAKKDDAELQKENGTIEWTYTVGGKTVTTLEEAIALAKQTVLTLSQNDGAGVNWYVLKKEADGWHIDGVSQIPNVVISVSGKFVAAPEATPSASPEVTPSASPSATPSESPSASPSATPSESPSATPSESPSATPSESPSATPSTSPEATPSASPSTSPSATPAGNPTVPDDPDDGDDDDDDDDIVIIDDAPVALADVPAAPAAPADGPAVLGARRTEAPAEEAAVLGAKRGTDYAVLGKRRRPETGDSAAMNAWMAAMAMATGVAGVSGVKLVKGKKKEESND